MNRTRLAQLAAVLGAAVLLVLAVAVTRTDLGRHTTVAGPAMDTVGTQEPDEAGSGAGRDVPEPAQPGDTPMMGPTASAPGDQRAPGVPGDAGPLPGSEGDSPDGMAGDGPTSAPGADQATLPQEPRNPFAPGAAGGQSAPSTTAPATTAPAGDDTSTGGSTAETPAAEDPPAQPPVTQPPATQPPATQPPVSETPATGSPAAGPSTGTSTSAAPAKPDDGTARPAPQPEVDAPEPGTHHVAPGDTLWDIAEAALGQSASNAQVAVAVDQLYELNRDVIGGDPDLILPGQVFELPDW